MKPVIALVGRPNVGKSTLFNQLTRSRNALVMDLPGLTRDRQIGEGQLGPKPFLVIDTGGLEEFDAGTVQSIAMQQTWQAIMDADICCFIVDAKAGLTHQDQEVFAQLRARDLGKPIHLVINKSEGRDPDLLKSDFYSLGLDTIYSIAATHNSGVRELIEELLEPYPEAPSAPLSPLEANEDNIMIAIVGRPNVGKSTLVNRLLGEERVVVYDQPGTTRDSIYIPFERLDRKYTLIDTAGVRKRGRIKELQEKFSVVKTLQAINAAQVVIFVLDAHHGLTEYDRSLLGFVIESGRALVLAINKWDGLTPEARTEIKTKLVYHLRFADFAETLFISALHGTNVGHLYQAIHKAYGAAFQAMSTAHLTRLLAKAVDQHPPPLVRGRRIKLRYAHAGGHNPPIIIIHGNQTERLPDTYSRYLNNFFMEALKLTGTPIRVQYKTAHNPFAEKQEKRLTPLQKRKLKLKPRH